MAKNPQMKGPWLAPGSTIDAHGLAPAIMMSEYLERLRFLRRALDDGLIAQEDFALNESGCCMPPRLCMLHLSRQAKLRSQSDTLSLQH